MFVGQFEHSLDDKGRVVLPASFRHDLAERGYVSQFDQCLGLWTEEGFKEVAERLTERMRNGEASQMALRAFSANAHQVKLDTQGRISIPERLREFAGLDRDVIVIGAFERIEIWDAERWRSVQGETDQELTDAVTKGL